MRGISPAKRRAQQAGGGAEGGRDADMYINRKYYWYGFILRLQVCRAVSELLLFLLLLFLFHSFLTHRFLRLLVKSRVESNHHSSASCVFIRYCFYVLQVVLNKQTSGANMHLGRGAAPAGVGRCRSSPNNDNPIHNGNSARL